MANADEAAMRDASSERGGLRELAGIRSAIQAARKSVSGGFRTAVEALMRGVRSAAPGSSWGGRKRRMEMVESLALGGRKQLFLVECDRQRYLVGGGSEGVATIVAVGGGEGVPLRRPETTGTRGLRLVRRRLDAEGHWTGYEKNAPKIPGPWR